MTITRIVRAGIIAKKQAHAEVRCRTDDRRGSRHVNFYNAHHGYMTRSLKEANSLARRWAVCRLRADAARHGFDLFNNDTRTELFLTQCRMARWSRATAPTELETPGSAVHSRLLFRWRRREWSSTCCWLAPDGAGDGICVLAVPCKRVSRRAETARGGCASW